MFRRKPGFFREDNLEVVLGKVVVGFGDKEVLLVPMRNLGLWWQIVYFFIRTQVRRVFLSKNGIRCLFLLGMSESCRFPFEFPQVQAEI